MFARVLILSLCLSVLLPAALIDEIPIAPPPITTPSVTDEEPPPFQLNLSYLLNMALMFNYLDFGEPDVQDNILAAIAPAYEAWLNHFLGASWLGPGFDAPATVAAPMSMIEVFPPPTLTALDTAAGAGALDVAVPEPSSWLLAAAGVAVLIRRRYR